MRVPPELLEYKQWVLWRRAEVNGRMTKVPISPWSGKAAACNQPQTWSRYRHVRYALHRFPCDGIGFVFTDADPFCGIDLDHCRAVTGTIGLEALDMIRRFASYTELSPSGTGAHILIKGKLYGPGHRTGNIEIYDSGRYFTVTGKHLSGTPFAIHNRQEALGALERAVLLGSFVPE
jgi:putative DNA primase/helicase